MAPIYQYGTISTRSKTDWGKMAPSCQYGTTVLFLQVEKLTRGKMAHFCQYGTISTRRKTDKGENGTYLSMWHNVYKKENLQGGKWHLPVNVAQCLQEGKLTRGKMAPTCQCGTMSTRRKTYKGENGTYLSIWHNFYKKEN
jgi:hypothetical protein